MRKKNYSLQLLAVFMLILFISCVPWEPEGDRSNFALSTSGESVVLNWNRSFSTNGNYVWYRCVDEQKTNPERVGDGKSFATEEFTKPEIRYYFCVFEENGEVKYQSPVFFASYTGLATAYLNTEDGQEITKKTEYKQAFISIKSSSVDLVKNLDPTQVLVKGRGSSSWLSMENKSYNLKFDGKEKILKSVSKGKRWCLIANQIDNSEMGNFIASYIGNQYFNSVWEPSFGFVNLVVNGEYRGLYIIGENIKINKDRVDIPDILDEEEPVTSYEDGGYILEITADTNESSFATLGGLTITFKDPDLDVLPENCGLTRREIIEKTRQKVNRLENAILQKSGEDFRDLMDLNSMVDWYCTNMMMANTESDFKTSCYFYYNPAEQKFFMGPNWDFDRSFTNRDTGKMAVSGKRNIWYSALESNPIFVAALKNKWDNFLSGGKVSELLNYISETDEMIEVARDLDRLRWGKEVVGIGESCEWMQLHLEKMALHIEGLYEHCKTE